MINYMFEKQKKVMYIYLTFRYKSSKKSLFVNG